MNNQLLILSKLQLLTQRKNAILQQKAKVNVDDVRHLWQEVKLLAQNVAADKEKLVCLEKVCARQEADLRDITKQCQQMEAKLYGGEITNLKELEQVRAKCDLARKDVISREDEAFAGIDYYERLAAQIAKSEIELQQKKRLHAEKQQIITHASADFDARLAEIETEYSSLASKVEPVVMSKFHDLGRRVPMPVAKVENGICGGCRMSIPTNQVTLTHTQVVYCDNCGRMLFTE